uniref:Fibronectin type-III domain-containing protein n=1 Tax=Macrostomum lignano TaxID=282301 RepID=A0A1I8H6R4_9PLAT
TGWYNLTLIARDGGTPQLTGTTALTFYVAPAEQGSAVDDSALARFRNALISTTIILIAGCAVSLLFMIRTYLKSRNMMRMYNGLDDNRAAHRPSSSSISWSKDNSVGPMADKEATPKPAAQTPPSKGLPEVEKPAML